MHLYRRTTEQFMADATHPRPAELLSERFVHEFGYKQAISEVNAWRNSVVAMSRVLRVAPHRGEGVLVELHHPTDFELGGRRRTPPISIGSSVSALGIRA
jgi:hypothetical protein